MLSLSDVTILSIRFLIYEIGRATNDFSPILISFDSFSHGPRLSSTDFLFACRKYRVDVDVQVGWSLFMHYSHADGSKVIGSLFNRYATLSS